MVADDICGWLWAFGIWRKLVGVENRWHLVLLYRGSHSYKGSLLDEARRQSQRVQIVSPLLHDLSSLR